MYDPLELAAKLENIVVQGDLRKYYRLIRKDRWYGGICTSDCVGCNLRCVFCWSRKVRESPQESGTFYAPQDIFQALTKCAKRYNIGQLRISGNEPTIGKAHLFEVLKLIDTTPYRFILETNGTLIDKDYAEELAKFKNLHVRVSIKGTNPQEFSRLSGAYPESYQLQLNALKNLSEERVSFHPAIMLSFSTLQDIKQFKSALREIHPSLENSLEEEYVFLYPQVAKQLKKAGIKPTISYGPRNIPEELI
ncbi:MAG: radical SAM protein [Candidatus Omnitrophota bacterium]|nr:MAG: radical SAM protein [Candidatus Omnitrophota bacterium]